MSRRRFAAKRDITPDPRHGSETLSRFINMLMDSGKKSVAERIVYGALEIMEAAAIPTPSVFWVRRWITCSRWLR